MKTILYFGVFGVLVGSTAGELLMIGLPLPQSLVTSTIIALAGLKAALIALFFQHLKEEPKALSSLVLLPLLGVVALMAISLLSIQALR